MATKKVDVDAINPKHYAKYKIQPVTFGKKKKKILGLLPGSKIIEKIIQNIFFEVNSSNKILWLYKA